MDKPIFGDENRGLRNLVYGILAVITLFALSSMGIGVVIGVLDKKDIGLVITGGAVFIVLIVLFLLIKWYQADALEPKFRILIILLAFQALAMSVNNYYMAFGIKDISVTCFEDEKPGNLKAVINVKDGDSFKPTCISVPPCLAMGIFQSQQCAWTFTNTSCSTFAYPNGGNFNPYNGRYGCSKALPVQPVQPITPPTPPSQPVLPPASNPGAAPVAPVPPQAVPVAPQAGPG